MFAVVIQHATGVLVKEEIVVIEANHVEMLHKNGMKLNYGLVRFC